MLHVVGSLHIGGAENIAMNFSRYLDKKKFEIDYLVFENTDSGYEQEAKNLGAEVIKISSPKNNYLKYLLDMNKIFKNNKYDIVHTHMMLNNGIICGLAKLNKIKFIVSHAHSTNSGRNGTKIYNMYEKVMKYIIKKTANEIIACGKDAGNYLYGEKYFKDNGKVIDNYIEVDKYEYDETLRDIITNELGLEGKKIIGHVGRFADVKNHKFLLDIFKLLYEKNKNLNLILIGDGELKEEIIEYISKNNIRNVFLLGERKDVNRIMQCIDVIIFPSKYEGFPVTLIEAQAASIKCIVSDKVTKYVKVSELIKFVSLDASKEKWSNIVMESLSTDKKREEISELKKKFDISNNIKTMEKIYEFKFE